MKRALRWIERTLAILGLLFLIYFAAFDLSRMTSDSMAPTLVTGDWILTEKISAWLVRPRRWEVITFRDRDGQQLMKRVVALPGETISLPDVGDPSIDGRRVEAPFRYLPAGNLAGGAAFPAGDGWYVLGDEVRDSLDSRFEGAVPWDHLSGRAWLRIWPPSRFGLIR